MPIKTQDDKFQHELAEMYDAEQQFLIGQREMLRNAALHKLKELLLHHIAESEHQVKNLDEIFKAFDQEPHAAECAGARGIVEEARKMMEEAENSAVLDALIAGAAAKVENYEIASYQSLLTGAEHLKTESKDHDEKKEQMAHKDLAIHLLQENMNQEEAMARRLEGSAKVLESRVEEQA